MQCRAFLRVSLLLATWLVAAAASQGLHAADADAGSDADAVSLSVGQPAARPGAGYYTDQATVDLAGVAASPEGITSVQITTPQGPTLQARLLRSADGKQMGWRVKGVFLRPGSNAFQVKAIDALQRESLRYVTVVRGGPEAAPMAIEGTAMFGNRPVPYRNIAGRAIVEGDIDIGPAAGLGHATASDSVRADGLGIATAGQLWPKVGGIVQIPYTTSSGNANVAPAIAQFNSVFSGSVQWVARGAQADYVDFNLDPNDHSGSGFAAVGRVGGMQQIGGSIDADVGTLLHEMGHAVGLLHEQSRPDRDAYVKLLDANIIKTLRPNFDVVLENTQGFGLYDHASVMHYQAFTFSKNGEPTLESIPAGIPMSELGTYSASDIDTVLRLYQLAPTAVTVTSNPPGLQVVVDGVTVTTPRTFNFALGSTHTLDTPTTPQTLSGKNYIYGRWNDNTQRSHTITIARGNGLTGSPTNRPAVTVYSANFIELVPYAPWVYPTGAGHVTATPAPLSYPPLAGQYFVKRQPVSLQATAGAGYAFYRLYTAYGPVSQSPKVTRNPDWVLAYFTPQQKTTIGTSPAGRWVWIDGQWYEGPVAFSPYYPGDGNWAIGTSHHLDVAVNPQLPYSYSIRYPWTNWSDGGAQAHDITVPAGNSTLTARFGQQFYAATWAQQPCAGSVGMSPASPDGFYASGTSLSFLQTPVPGWTFTGWTGDFSGKTNPKVLAMNDERLMVANYNATATPVAITGLTPANKVAGQAAFTLKIAGTGFTSNSSVYIGGSYRAPTSITAKQIQVPVTAADIQAAGAVQVFVQTTPPGNWSCSAYAARSLQVRTSSTQPLATPSAKALNFASQAVGSTSPAQNATLANAGNTPLALHDVVLVGDQPGDFLLTTTCNNAVPATGQCAVSVRFKPTASGSRTARLLFLDSAFDSPQAITLSGTAP